MSHQRHLHSQRRFSLHRKEITSPSTTTRSTRRRIMLNKNSGEYRLLLSLLEQAITDLDKHKHATRRKHRLLFTSAHTWLFDEQDWIFSAECVCAGLGLHVDHVRRGVRDILSGKTVWRDIRLSVLNYNQYEVQDVDTFNEKRRRAA